MVKQLDRIEQKVDKLDHRLDNVDITLAKQHVSLDEHIKRTALLESKVIPLEKAHAIGKAIRDSAKAHKDKMGASPAPEKEDMEDDDSEGEMYMEALINAIHDKDVKEATEAMEHLHSWLNRDQAEEHEKWEAEHEESEY